MGAAILAAFLGRRIFRRVFGNDCDGLTTSAHVLVDEASEVITEAHAKFGRAFLSEREHMFWDADSGAGVAHLGWLGWSGGWPVWSSRS